jgi:hypothetical protein
MTEIKYTEVVRSVSAAVSGDIALGNKWLSAGENVRGFYGTEAALTEVKAQFIADAILPAIDKRHAAALALELPRKGSKEFNEMTEANRAKWESANQAKKDARAVAHTMFSRVVKYAFPSEKAESTPRTLKTRFCEDIAALIKAGEKAESAEFDVVVCLNHLRAALAVAAK